MPESIGTVLRNRRVGKGLEIEDASRDTKIRPALLRDLENDDFGNFPSLVYAKGFLKKYAGYLGVDATPYLERLDTKSPATEDNFQYLTYEAEPELRAIRPSRKKIPQLLGLLLILFLVLFVIGAVIYLKTSWERIYPPAADAIPQQEQTQQVDQNIAESDQSQEAPPATNTQTAGDQLPQPQGFMDDKPIMRALPVDADTGSATGPAGPEKRIVVRATDKTWVKVIRNSPQPEIIYDNWLSPDDQELVYSGQHFLITVMNMDRVEILSDGEPVNIESTAVEIR